MMISITAWLSKPNLDWFNCDKFTWELDMDPSLMKPPRTCSEEEKILIKSTPLTAPPHTHLEEHLDAVNEEEDHDDEQENGVASVEDVREGLAIGGEELREEYLSRQQTVREQVEGQKAEEALGQELRLFPANIPKVEHFRPQTHDQ